MRRPRASAVLLVAALLAGPGLALLAPRPAAADARLLIRVGERRDHGHRDGDHRGRDHHDWRHRHGHHGHHDHGHHHHGHRLFVPRHVFVPAVVVPAPVWVPGYWTWRWVPQWHTTYVYVPGYYDAYGQWVASRYEPRTVESGVYQQVWVEGYWR
jgi:hypothetical protein